VKPEQCFCGGDGKYVDYNCGESFYVGCPHCLGTGQKKCDCANVSSLVCKKFGRGQEIVEPTRRRDDLLDEALDEDDSHWMFMD
jgi:hypothetical protein